MSESEDKLKQLQIRLENLAKYEAAFKREITDIRREINLLKTGSRSKNTAKAAYEENLKEQKPPLKETPPYKIPPQPNFKTQASTSAKPQPRKPEQHQESNIEQFIGKYLISIIGILVTIIGVGIGVKFAIDNNYISPLMRIVFGYAVGLGLTGCAVYLKEKYHSFSSVLLSGGMAIMYFVTFFAYSYYSLISQTSAFLLMVIFTIFTVLSSIIYNRQIIAHIGLVGAYAVPFMLSSGSGRVDILFSYIAIINIGILAVSLKKYWKYLFYSSFIFTWLIYAVWYLDNYDYSKHFSLALAFLTIFFLIFYLTFLAYKLIHKKPFNVENVALILQNSFLFFGFGYAILDSSAWDNFKGLFTVINGVIHFIVAAVIHRYKLGDKNAFYLIIALVLTFVTIAIPIQLDGNWITILWIAEAVFLFVVGRTKKIPLFEYFSYPLIIFASISLLTVWQSAYQPFSGDLAQAKTPLFNEDFITSLCAAIGFAIIFIVDRNKRYKPETDETIFLAVRYFVPAALLVILYNTFRIEIGNYFHYQEVQTVIKNRSTYSGYGATYLKDESLEFFNVIWQIMYSMFFLTVLSYLNTKKIKNSTLGFINIGLNSFTIFVFLTVGLVVLGELRENYLTQVDAEHFSRGIYHIVIRYISFAFVVLIVKSSYEYIRQEFLTKIIPEEYLSISFDLGVCFTLWVILSSELINWTDMLRIEESYKLGLSILWGLYAIALIVLGIIQRKKHLRVFAIALFAVTLVKLFFYDIAELDTISKTIVFVTIGILLLIASFLYNKYTKLIFGEDKPES